MIDDVLRRVQKERETCPKDDFRRMHELDEILKTLAKEKLRQATQLTNVGNTGLYDVTKGLLFEGACGLLLLNKTLP